MPVETKIGIVFVIALLITAFFLPSPKKETAEQLATQAREAGVLVDIDDLH
jgi:hypothetical protein